MKIRKSNIQKNNLNVFSKKLAKGNFQIGIGYERGRNRFWRVWKEVNSVEFSSSQKESARYKFESYCKKVIREYYRDLVKKMIRVASHEIGFQELSAAELDSLFEYGGEELTVGAARFDTFGAQN